MYVHTRRSRLSEAGCRLANDYSEESVACQGEVQRSSSSGTTSTTYTHPHQLHHNLRKGSRSSSAQGRRLSMSRDWPLLESENESNGGGVQGMGGGEEGQTGEVKDREKM